MGTKQTIPFDEKQIDEWLKAGHSPEDVKTLLQQITKAVLERALQGEIGTVDLETRRDRNGKFEPQLIQKHQRRFRL